jgi:hypothetical protein
MHVSTLLGVTIDGGISAAAPGCLSNKENSSANQRTTQSGEARGAFHCFARVTKDEAWLCMKPKSASFLAEGLARFGEVTEISRKNAFSQICWPCR